MKEINEKVEKQNILKISEIKEDGNHVFYFDNELYDKKLQEYKDKVDNGIYDINDTIMNMGLVANRLLQEEKKEYRAFGQSILDILYGDVE